LRIAVASGKGGTGKTTVATNLAWIASKNPSRVAYLDCDVEEPNGAIFLHPDIEDTRPVCIPVPRLDSSLCDGCGLCGQICQYSAVVCISAKVLLFPELCHGCAGCRLVCPTAAIGESRREIGRLEIGRAGRILFAQGLLNVGEAMSPPVIRELIAQSPESDLTLIDAPPGTSCPVIESVRDADFVLLVTEPTPFGLNDLKLAVEMVRALDLPFAVVVNRFDMGDEQTRSYCRSEGIDIVAEIPDDRRVAEAYSRGELACTACPEYGAVFDRLFLTVRSAVPVPTTAGRAGTGG
jgi:MinD superfamily P-loop ATPase